MDIGITRPGNAVKRQSLLIFNSGLGMNPSGCLHFKNRRFNLAIKEVLRLGNSILFKKRKEDLSIDNKKLCSDCREGTMWLSIIGDLITHAWF